MKVYPIFFAVGFSFACATLKKSEPVGEKATKTIVLRRVMPDQQLAQREPFCVDGEKALYLKDKMLEKKLIESPEKNSRRVQRKLRLSLSTQARRQISPLRLMSDKEYDMPIEHNAMVEKWLQYYQSSGKVTLLKWLIRAESLKEQIQDQLVSNGVPKNLFYLAMIESGLNVSVKSRARAVGTWQFMNLTGLSYDLENNYWVDERRDPIKSTVAAAKYLRYLYKRYDSWYLALAAYNAGPGKISRAIRKTKSKNYWDLIDSRYLRAETKNYVPKFIAAYLIAMDPEHYGFYVARNSALDYPTSYISLSKTVSINELAAKLNVSADKIFRWNPELKRSNTPPSSKPYLLRLEQGLVKKFSLIKGDLEDLKISELRKHKIRRGETLSSIARKYKISLSELRSLNPKARPRRLLAGKSLVVPF